MNRLFLPIKTEVEIIGRESWSVHLVIPAAQHRVFSLCVIRNPGSLFSTMQLLHSAIEYECIFSIKKNIITLCSCLFCQEASSAVTTLTPLRVLCHYSPLVLHAHSRFSLSKSAIMTCFGSM